MNPFEPPTVDAPVLDDLAARQVKDYATKSVLLGGIGILCCGVVLGPLAISYANRAEAHMISTDQGLDQATTIKVGRVLGYVAIAFWFLALVMRVAGLLMNP
jgi:hypothetical protein